MWREELQTNTYHCCECRPAQCKGIVKSRFRVRPKILSAHLNAFRCTVSRQEQESCKDQTKQKKYGQEANKHCQETAVERPAEVLVHEFLRFVAIFSVTNANAQNVDSNQVDRNGKYSVGLWGNKVVELSRHYESTMEH